MAEKKIYPIRYVVRHTGLSPHLIRSWERRYGAVTPQRTGTNRRLYSAQDVEKLIMLRQALSGGHSIGQIASLDNAELRGLSETSPREPAAADVPKSAGSDAAPPRHYEACLDAIRRFDAAELEKSLNNAAVELNRILLIEQVLVPIVEKIGEEWADGSIRIYQEHAASSVLRTFLGDLLHFGEAHPAAPALLAATPAGQHHELGAMIAAVAAAHTGWRVIYLGPDLPAEEIAGAAEKVQPEAVCLSLVYPADDPNVVWEIKKLRRILRESVRLIIGGRAAGAVAVHLGPADAEVVRNIPEFIKALNSKTA